MPWLEKEIVGKGKISGHPSRGWIFHRRLDHLAYPQKRPYGVHNELNKSYITRMFSRLLHITSSYVLSTLRLLASSPSLTSSLLLKEKLGALITIRKKKKLKRMRIEYFAYVISARATATTGNSLVSNHTDCWYLAIGKAADLDTEKFSNDKKLFIGNKRAPDPTRHHSLLPLGYHPLTPKFDFHTRKRTKLMLAASLLLLVIIFYTVLSLLYIFTLFFIFP